MGVQLFAKAVNTAQYQRLDLFESEPIKLTLSVANIQDPLAANSVFSRTFRVPHTSANGPFFKAAFNVNATDFDASKKADAYINDNGVFFSVGNIRLSAVYVNEKTSNIEYEINYYGETSDFGSKIGGGFLSEVNLSAYNHNLTYNNVVNSWSGGLLGGNVVYPLIEWGYNYNSAGVPSVGTMSVGGVRSFTGTTNLKAIQFPQLKPTLKAKALWDAIFAETGYTYESTFIETDPLFTNLFVIAENDARALISADLNFEADDFGVTNDVGTGLGSGIPYVIDMQFPNEITDPSNAYNPTASHYTAEAPGTYTFEVSGYAEGVWSNPAANTAVLFKIVDVNTGTVLSTTSPQPVLQAPQSFTKSLAAVLTVGQTVKLQVEGIGPIAPVATSYITFFGCTFKTISVPNIITMSSFMPTNIRKVDFMRSIINRFRLVFVPSKDNEKHFEITPWKDWVLQGNQRDWTNKLDGTKDMKITPLFYGQERLQVYKDQEDADFVNYNYQLDFKQTYGQLNQDSNNELIKGTKEYKDQFAPLPLYPIGGVDPGDAGYAFLIPHLAKDTDTKREPIQPKLRLAYYNGLQPAPITWYINSVWNPVSGIGSSPVARTTYPLMSQFSTWPVTNSTFDLNWENELPLYDTETSGLSKNVTTYDCFNVFWKTWYDTTFDPFSRIVEANFVLGYDDILNLRFNDYIFVKDSWYFINKITDYVIGEETNCRVELVKVGNNIGLVIPPSLPTKTLVEDICYGSTACEAFCCNTGGVTIGQYYITGTTWATATQVFLDPFGQVPAPNGFYSNGVITYQVSLGNVIVAANTAGCVCNPPLLTQFTACYGDNSCEACCCVNEEIQVWGTGSDLPSSINVYLNSSGTLPANGWYKAVGDTYSVNVVNGTTQAIGICSACNCNPTPVFEHQVTFNDESLCNACCIGAPVTIYTDNATFTSSTIVYIDNVPLTLSGAGWYAYNGDVLVVNSSGVVTGIGTCSGCACLNYYVGENCQSPGLLANFSHTSPLNIGDVVDTPIYFDQCWTIIGPAASGDPIENVYTSCAECATNIECDCIEYLVNTLTGGAIQYIDCTTGDVVYQDIMANSSQNICMCENTPVVLSGKIKITVVGPCDVPLNEIIVAGTFSDYDGQSTERLALLDADGNVQNTFSTFQGGGNGFEPNNTPQAYLTNDNIFAYGSFTSYNSTTANRIVKLDYTGANAGGSFTTGYNGNVNNIDKFADGVLVTVGGFTTYKGITRNRIVAIDQNGVVDSTFVIGTGFNNTFNRVIVKNDVAYCLSYTTNPVTYKGGTCSRFCALDRSGNLITNFGLAGSDIPSIISYDVDNLGRVYIAYVKADLEIVRLRRLLPNGTFDATYNYQFPTQPWGTSFDQPAYIKVMDNYDVILAFQNGDATLESKIFKVNPNGNIDTTFNTHLIQSGKLSSGNILPIKNNNILIALETTAHPITYDLTTVGNLISINATTGALTSTFNNQTGPAVTQFLAAYWKL